MGLFFARRPVRVRPVRRARLSLEFLERREQPSDFFLPPTGQTPNTPVYGPPAESSQDDNAPSIQNFTIIRNLDGSYTIRGYVSDEQPGGLTVTFGGGINGIDDKTATTDANGYFTFTVTLPVGTSGGVTATVHDSQGQQSASVSRYLEVVQ